MTVTKRNAARSATSAISSLLGVHVTKGGCLLLPALDRSGTSLAAMAAREHSLVGWR